MAHEWTAERLRKVCIVCENIQERGKVFKKLAELGFKNFGDVDDSDLCINCDSDMDYMTYNWINDDETPLSASRFLNDTPPSPELTALKKRLMEIADSDRNELEKNYQYEGYIHNFIAYNIVSNTHATDLANLIISSDL